MEKRHKNSTAESQLLKKLIKDWKLPQSLLALKMGMPIGTFGLKINETNGLYRFTPEETLRLASVLDTLLTDTQNVLSELDQDCSELLGSHR